MNQILNRLIHHHKTYKNNALDLINQCFPSNLMNLIVTYIQQKGYKFVVFWTVNDYDE